MADDAGLLGEKSSNSTAPIRRNVSSRTRAILAMCNIEIQNEENKENYEPKTLSSDIKNVIVEKLPNFNELESTGSCDIENDLRNTILNIENDKNFETILENAEFVFLDGEPPSVKGYQDLQFKVSDEFPTENGEEFQQEIIEEENHNKNEKLVNEDGRVSQVVCDTEEEAVEINYDESEGMETSDRDEFTEENAEEEEIQDENESQQLQLHTGSKRKLNKTLRMKGKSYLGYRKPKNQDRTGHHKTKIQSLTRD